MVASGSSSLLAGKVTVVTGATGGIGRAVAEGLARRGATVVVVGRGPGRAEVVAREIAAVTGNPQVHPEQVADLAVRSEMFGLAGRLLAAQPRIDVLVNNAGGIFAHQEKTSDGLERTFALNVLAPFVLSRTLGPRMGAAGPARIIQIASAAHRGAQLDVEDLPAPRHYRAWRAYSRSKLALILLTREFARRWPAAQVTVNAVHPGFVRSGFAQNNPGWLARLVRLSAAIGGISAEAGADTPLYVATDPGLAAVTGQYFSHRRVAPGSRASQDLEVAQKLYELCDRIAGGAV
jgi:NAD(P)-dependent dehydrogenase (short-subunit alcohol dehydrogenase family)